jgi:hypothetical protein
MEPVTYTTSITATSTPVTTYSVGFDLFAVFTSLFGESEAVARLLSGEGIWGFLGSIWSTFSVIAYIVSIILLVLYVFASIRRNLYGDLMTQELRDAEDLYAQQYQDKTKHGRLDDVIANAASEKPNDWKLAIIEADIVLDETLKQKGYMGVSLGERLKSVTGTQMSTINDAWEAHKIRNRIAHDGADFVLTKRIADETISRYLRVFEELGIY